MSDVIHKTTKVHKRSVNTSDFPTADYVINPTFSPDEATVLAAVPLYRKITGSDVSVMSAGEQTTENNVAANLNAEKARRKTEIDAKSEAIARIADHASGDALKTSIDDATDRAGVDAVVDNR